MNYSLEMYGYGSWYGSGPFAKSSASEGVVAVAICCYGFPSFFIICHLTTLTTLVTTSGNKMHVSNRDPFSTGAIRLTSSMSNKPRVCLTLSQVFRRFGLQHATIPNIIDQPSTTCRKTGKTLRKLLRKPWGNSEQYWYVLIDVRFQV